MPAKAKISKPEGQLDAPSEMARLIPIAEVVRLTSLSRDSLLRHHRDKIRRVSPRRLAMRLGDVLELGEPI